MTRPIDMQVMLPKLQMTHHARESVVHKEANALHAAQMQGKQEAEKRQHEVKALDEKEHDPLKNNTKGESQHRRGKKRSAPGKAEDGEETTTGAFHEPGHGDRFDMKV
jgi:hypothetical protein